MDAAGLKVVEPVNDCLAAAMNYQSYHLMKKLFCYDKDVAHELHMLTMEN